MLEMSMPALEHPADGSEVVLHVHDDHRCSCWHQAHWSRTRLEHELASPWSHAILPDPAA
jgi:hypothetical protein